MRKSEMSKAQLDERNLVADTLTAAGWHFTGEYGERFEDDDWLNYEATMEYSNQGIDLRFDYYCQERDAVLYVESPEGKSLEITFLFEGYLERLLQALISIQDVVSPQNLEAPMATLLEACPEMFTVTPDGDRVRVKKT